MDDVKRSQFITVDIDGEECTGIVVRADDKDNEDGSRHVMATVFVPADGTWRVWEGPLYQTRGDARTVGDNHGRPTVAYSDADSENTSENAPEKGSQGGASVPKGTPASKR